MFCPAAAAAGTAGKGSRRRTEPIPHVPADGTVTRDRGDLPAARTAKDKDIGRFGQ